MSFDPTVFAAMKKEPVVGTTFTCPTGASATVMAGKSEDGKVQAELTCTTPGCTNKHVRVSSDWHQCGRCGDCAKKRRNKTGGKKAAKPTVDVEAKKAELDAQLQDMTA